MSSGGAAGDSKTERVSPELVDETIIIPSCISLGLFFVWLLLSSLKIDGSINSSWWEIFIPLFFTNVVFAIWVITRSQYKYKRLAEHGEVIQRQLVIPTILALVILFLIFVQELLAAGFLQGHRGQWRAILVPTYIIFVIAFIHALISVGETPSPIKVIAVQDVTGTTEITLNGGRNGLCLPGDCVNRISLTQIYTIIGVVLAIFGIELIAEKVDGVLQQTAWGLVFLPFWMIHLLVLIAALDSWIRRKLIYIEKQLFKIELICFLLISPSILLSNILLSVKLDKNLGWSVSVLLIPVMIASILLFFTFFAMMIGMCCKTTNKTTHEKSLELVSDYLKSEEL